MLEFRNYKHVNEIIVYLQGIMLLIVKISLMDDLYIYIYIYNLMWIYLYIVVEYVAK